MFEAKDFELSLETELKLRVVNDDIDKCTDLTALRESLKSTAGLLARYQQILNSILKKQLDKEVDRMFNALEENDKINKDT